MLSHHEWQLTGHRLQRKFPFWSPIVAAGVNSKRILKKNRSSASPLSNSRMGRSDGPSTTRTADLKQQHNKRNDRKNCHSLWPYMCPRLVWQNSTQPKTFEQIEDDYTVALPILYRNQVRDMATTRQRKHSQAPAMNHTFLKVLENFIETSKRSNFKLIRLLLRGKKDKNGL